MVEFFKTGGEETRRIKKGRGAGMYSFTLLTNEAILKKGHACLEMEDCHLYGALYLTTERLIFVGYNRLDVNKYRLEIFLAHIEHLHPGKTWRLFQNVIRVATFQGLSCKFTVNERDQWVAQITEQMDKI